MINWLSPNNIGALQLSINHVVNIRPPVCPIPPPSTMLLTASICQRLVVAGGRFKTQIKVDVTAIEDNRHQIAYTLAFAQNTNHTLTQTIPSEEHFIQPDGLCCVPLFSLDTDDADVLAEATTGAIFTDGCIAIAQHFLEQCHNIHHGFTKWVVRPATGRSLLVPDAGLTHTIRIIAQSLEDIMPTTHIPAANQNNPLSTHN
jgi:hypothetical protein